MIPQRTVILIPAASQYAALALAPQVNQPSLKLFPLCPANGPASAAATFYGANGPLHWDSTKEPANAATLVQATPSFPGAFFWRGTPVDAQTMKVTSDWSGTLAAGFTDGKDVGKTLSFAQFLALVGLQPQVKPLS